MKTMNMILAMAVMMTGAFAHAGAYGFSCTDAYGIIEISKGQAFLKQYDAVNGEDKLMPVEYASKTLPDYASEKPENPKTAVSIEIVGKKKQIVDRAQTDECGNVGREDIFAAKLIVRDPQGKLISHETVICDQSFYPGHCF
ncbi:hypothetical protein DOM22_12950 [Bdellovibrio sp. ZAP7]|uniref:hypothetical protein n=1 Tax=Bdellovibrio sp. ZAP7 TaxID=2231053 RepID=UPI0011571A46|nr:hypothetical protein [Bdellovibrio sp. ZAP7]QDK45995.1 hypothetical protein DOM22_12950 [Bdellovibrio sp. ZAP7]